MVHSRCNFSACPVNRRLGFIKRNPVLTTSISVVTLLAALTGVYIRLGDSPPWAGVEGVAQVQQSLQDMGQSMQRTRYSQVLSEIGRLEEARRVRRISGIENDYLGSLLIERRQLACLLRLEKC